MCSWLDVHGKRDTHETGCAIGMYLMYISVVFKLCLCIVTFISKLALGMVNKRIMRRLDAEDVNRGLGMLEAGRTQWHVGVLGMFQGTVARM